MQPEASSGRPLVAFAVMTSWGPAYPRIARWMRTGLREVGARADVVYIDRATSDPVRDHRPATDDDSRVRQVVLGARRARVAIPRLVGYLRDVQPSMTLVTPGGAIGAIAVVAGALARQQVLPWETTVPLMDLADVPRYLGTVKRVTDRLYGHAPRVVAVSHGVRDALIADLGARIGPDRFVVIPNPVDGDEVRRLASPRAARTGRLRLCSVGRLASAKGFDVLIRALALADLGEAWELVIVGDGPLRSQIERSVAQLGLVDHVRLVGHLANPYPVLASADIAVQASRWEGFGVAALEALALGVPLIATSCPGGMAEILDGGQFGILVPPDDAHELARAIRKVADDKELRGRLTELGLARAAAYAPGRIAQQVVDLATHAPFSAGRPRLALSPALRTGPRYGARPLPAVRGRPGT